MVGMLALISHGKSPMIIIHSSETCRLCRWAKALLKSENLEYKEISHNTPEEKAAFKALGYPSFPQIIIDGELIGGYDKLKAYFDPNKNTVGGI